jgi:hypothetical protein
MNNALDALMLFSAIALVSWCFADLLCIQDFARMRKRKKTKDL